ncbi:unnamed protein product [Cylindrotheca closterium]|uniref:Uncharacterized protein n=1 Tax=Cylindrotheca closterium TaxID=2856 RepID=A0AAD2JMI6_9STRA|nr:unnamed protein product [Cylindrotheca closterium]
MSSRLIILPKKSYCPWSEENVQKVLRDEEKHAREVKASSANNNNDQTKTQNHNKHQDDDEKDDTKNLAPSGNFSLFAKEEKQAHIEQEKQIMSEKDTTRRRNHRHQPQHNYLRPFDRSTSAAMDSAVGLNSRKYKHSRKDAALKNRLDPMGGFCISDKEIKSDNKRVDVDDDHQPIDRKHSRSSERRRDRNQSHRRKSRRPSSSSSSEDSSSCSSSKKRRRNKRRREYSRSRESGSKSSSSSSTASHVDDSSQDRRKRRRKRRSTKPRSDRRRKKSRRANDGDGDDDARSKTMSKEEKAKRELLMRCAQREEEERWRQRNLRR